MRMRIFRTILLFSAVIGIFLGIFLYNHLTCLGLSCITFSGQNTFRLKDLYEQSKNVWRGMYTDGTTMIRLETRSGISQTDAKDYSTMRITLIMGLYDTVQSPYPGAVSQTIRCDDVYKPVVEQLSTEKGMPLTLLSGYLNSRMQFGACVDNEIVYRSDAAFLYCPKRHQWISLERIEPALNHASVAEIRSFFQTLSCVYP